MKKIGIAFAGGGALAAMEAGMVKALHELYPGIEVVNVSGVSMGSCNAAIYVGGTNPADDLVNFHLASAIGDSDYVTMIQNTCRILFQFISDELGIYLPSVAPSFNFGGIMNMINNLGTQIKASPLGDIVNNVSSLFNQALIKLDNYGILSAWNFNGAKLWNLNPKLVAKMGNVDAPLSIAPIVKLAENYFTYQKIASSPIKLYIGTSKIVKELDKVFTVQKQIIKNSKLNSAWMLASGTILSLSSLFNISGSYYCDGGYTENPHLSDLFQDDPDIILHLGLISDIDPDLSQLGYIPASGLNLRLYIQDITNKSIYIGNLINHLITIENELSDMKDIITANAPALLPLLTEIPAIKNLIETIISGNFIPPVYTGSYKKAPIISIQVPNKCSAEDFRLSTIQNSIDLGYAAFKDYELNNPGFLN
jgi:hypothetical protein